MSQRKLAVGFLALALCAGCDDYGALLKGFCDTANVELCDDFETPTINTNLWTVASTGAAKASVLVPPMNMVVDGTPAFAYRGHSSLELTASVGEGVTLTDDKITALPRTSLSVRVFAYFSNAVSPGSVELINVVGADGNPAWKVSIEDSVPRLTDVAGNRVFNANVMFAANTWTCIELRLADNDADPDADQTLIAQVVQDGFQIMSLPKLASLPALKSTSIGMTIAVTASSRPTDMGSSSSGPTDMGSSSTSQPAEMWLDEIILDRGTDQPIGCTL